MEFDIVDNRDTEAPDRADALYQVGNVICQDALTYIMVVRIEVGIDKYQFGLVDLEFGRIKYSLQPDLETLQMLYYRASDQLVEDVEISGIING